VFVNTCLRRILDICWPETISNEELRERAKGEFHKKKSGKKEKMELDRPYSLEN
jgi:hypothetical protein